MKKYIFTFVAVVLMASMIIAGDSKNYGKELTLKNKTKISDILANPKEYANKKVLVEGMIVDVCDSRGCWIVITGDKKYETLKVKVEDGVIVFPMEAKGKNALVEGELEIIESSKSGSSCGDGHDDAKKDCSHENTKVTYQLKGLGAVIK